MKYEVYASCQLASDKPHNKKELDHIKHTLNKSFTEWTNGEVTLSKFNYPEPKDWEHAEDGYEVWVGLTFIVRESYPIDSNFNVFNWKYEVSDLEFFPNKQTIVDLTDGEYKGKQVKRIA